jgi:hypothetical protein
VGEYVASYRDQVLTGLAPQNWCARHSTLLASVQWRLTQRRQVYREYVPAVEALRKRLLGRQEQEPGGTQLTRLTVRTAQGERQSPNVLCRIAHSPRTRKRHALGGGRPPHSCSGFGRLQTSPQSEHRT